MPDIYNYVGSDLGPSATGDLLTVDTTILGQQRVLRRLYTVPGTYIFHPTYGAGLPNYIGLPETAAQLRGVILRQMLLEEAVAQTPPPTVSVTFTPSGEFTVSIGYVDAQTGRATDLQFDVSN